MEGIWNAIKTHKWVAIGIGGAVIVGVIIYAVTHKSSSSSSTDTGDLLATSGSGPTGTTGGNGNGTGGGGGVSPANPVSGVGPVTGWQGTQPNDVISPPTILTPTPAVSPVSFTPPPTVVAPASQPYTKPTTTINGLSGVNYNPTPNTPNQITVGSGINGGSLQQIALPVGETVTTPVSVPNTSAGNPTVPLGDLISTGSTNTLSSAYGNASSAAALVGNTSQLGQYGGQAAAAALAAAQVAAASGPPPTQTQAQLANQIAAQVAASPKTTPVSAKTAQAATTAIKTAAVKSGTTLPSPGTRIQAA